MNNLHELAQQTKWEPLEQVQSMYKLQCGNHVLGFSDTHLYILQHADLNPADTRQIWAYNQAWKGSQMLLTPALITRIQETLPEWFDWDAAMTIMGMSHDEYKTSAPLLPGRFLVHSMREATTCLRDTLWLLCAHTVAISDIEYTPAVECLYTRPGSTLSIWTDGPCNMKVYHSDRAYHGAVRLSEAASNLLLWSQYQKYWKQENRWETLLPVQSHTTEPVATEIITSQGLKSSATDEYVLTKLVTNTGVTLYHIMHAGGGLFNGEGDAWREDWLYTNLDEAEQKLKEITE